MIEKTNKMEKVLQQVVKVLAANTNYATMITGPSYNQNKVKFIQLSKVNEDQLLAVIVVEGNLVKNQILNLEEPMDDEQILKLNLLLNTQLNGLTVQEINLSLISRMKEQAGIHSKVVSDVLDAVAEAIDVEEDVQVYQYFQVPGAGGQRQGQRADFCPGGEEGAGGYGEGGGGCGEQHRHPGLYRQRDSGIHHEGLQRGDCDL